jgi:hypothetical protein
MPPRQVSLDEEGAPEARRGLSEKEQSSVEAAQHPRAPAIYEIVRT